MGHVGDSKKSAGSQEIVWTVGKLLEWTSTWFREKQVEGGRLAAELLLARALDCQKIELYTRYDQVPTDEQRTAFRQLVRSAGEHTPIAYLLGGREFFSLAFEVTPAVLIPRPETEALAQRMIDLCRDDPDRVWRICDLGTGSGCVAVAIAKYAENANMVATDISPEAIEVATRNVERHGLTERIQLVQADGVALPPDVTAAGCFDVIVTNPPYVTEADWADLPPHIRDHEPRAALTRDGSDGLFMYRHFAAKAPAILCPEGRLLAEIGAGQLDAVKEVFAQAGGWNFIRSHRDPTDAHERVVEFQRA